MRTTNRRIRAYGLLSYRPRVVLPLANRHRQLQLTWCQGVMVWDAMKIGSRSLLVFLDRNMTAQSYINNVLQPVALPYLQQLQNQIFQQDNAR
nr:unnamed protein product [Callosobruchus chinensis]